MLRDHPIEIMPTVPIMRSLQVLSIPLQLLLGKLSQQFVHLVASVHCGLQQRLLHQRCQKQQRCAGNFFSCTLITAIMENGQTAQDLLLCFGQAAPRLLQQDEHAAMAFRNAVVARSKDIQAALDLADDLDRGQHIEPGRGQFDAQWNAIDQPTDAQNVFLFLFEIEVWLRTPGVRRESLNETVSS